ncbi:serine/threonine-protein phosphatase [Kitasatospora sp. NBC_00240]|uniref:SpoIIE family protein phosphatase n=1 Tax=Kitasatospora sp. NBC_00240 TaxID=2903567 RepID=UPI002255BB14|nr:PP2C family protein-serine/threonine phosphatase [Kitasatospora sp. NBC_00240]MCX5211422.1 serine/threonine-protein phosphatase [Kitasatospora sp. NBC_00240]
MPAAEEAARRRTGPRRWARAARRGPLGRWGSRLLDGDPAAARDALLLLLGLTALFTAMSVLLPASWPPSALVLPLVCGALVLSTRRQLALVAGVLAGSALSAAWHEPHGVRSGVTVVLALTAVAGLATARFRNRLGLRGLRGDSMLLELSEHTHALGRLPDRLLDWHFDRALAPVGGNSFSGDFLLCADRPEQDLLEVVLVDVSGKGSRAAARSMHLSGAFAMLLGSVPPESFLPAANDYLVGLGWEDEFATAVHLALRPASGEYRLFNAGHPPPAHYRREGGGSWLLGGDGGPALGLLPGSPYPATRGRLALGDSLLLYSDGLVEVPGQDIETGIGRLLAAAEPVLRAPRSAGGPAGRLLRAVARDVADDRSLVVVRRLGPPFAS